MSEVWPYDLIAEIYDEDMARNTDTADIEFYVERCRDIAGAILEIGCGTGRITLPLLAAGAAVTGIDRSPEMLKQLARKAEALPLEQRNRLELVHDRMERFSRPGAFSRILAPYSAFTYVAGEDEVADALAAVRRNLAAGGRFILDVFVPNPEVEATPPGHVFFDYRRTLPNGTEIERTKTIEQDFASSLNVIRRTYVMRDAGGAEVDTFTTTSRIRAYRPQALRSTLESHGFDIVAEWPDFGGGELGARTRMMAFECKAV